MTKPPPAPTPSPASNTPRLGVDTEAALRQLATIPLSLHCWQGDDVGGFEGAGGALGGGLAVTGSYPGQGAHRRTSCAPISRRPSRSFPAGIG